MLITVIKLKTALNNLNNNNNSFNNLHLKLQIAQAQFLRNLTCRY